ncbi:response regulator [bacterium]|nr:MAG: response regulator [bacterium]
MTLPTLLLVDDDLEFISAQAEALSSHFHVVQASGVNSSLDILQKKSVDCAMVDYYLEDGNGHDVAKWILNNMPWCPVVLVSAGLSKDIAVESFTHRIFDVLFNWTWQSQSCPRRPVLLKAPRGQFNKKYNNSYVNSRSDRRFCFDCCINRSACALSALR